MKLKQVEEFLLQCQICNVKVPKNMKVLIEDYEEVTGKSEQSEFFHKIGHCEYNTRSGQTIQIASLKKFESKE